MGAPTVRLPDGQHQRLRPLAQCRGSMLDRLIDDTATVMRAEFDAETRFERRAACGAGKLERRPALLDQAAGRGDR